MVHQWYQATDTQGTYVRILLLDFSKAFDLINHTILIDKLQTMGLPFHLVRWMGAFLLDRIHKVQIGNSGSELASPNGGVPQGTLSGPTKFLVHINDMSTPCPIYKYVDDSTIFEICRPGNICTIQESAHIAAQWSNDNDMRVNTSKTHELLIDFRRHQDHVVPYINMDGSVIQRSDNAKILGVTFSSDLTWNVHVDNIISKAGKRIYMLYQLKRAGIDQGDLLIGDTPGG